jgi:dTDP-glucose pyrophosphorylase
MTVELSGAILAAGQGARLRPFSGSLPKPLVDINGEPLLFRQVRAMKELGACPIHAIVNSETSRAMTERGLKIPGDLDLLVRDTPNSMESLLALGERIAPGNFVLMTVDAIIRMAEIRTFVTNATKLTANAESRLDGALAVVRWRGDANPLFTRIGSDGMIAALDRRQTPMVTAGLYLFATTIFDHAAEARLRGLDAMRQFLAMLLEKSMRFAALELQQAVDVDDSADLQAASAMLAGEAE